MGKGKLHLTVDIVSIGIRDRDHFVARHVSWDDSNKWLIVVADTETYCSCGIVVILIHNRAEDIVLLLG